MLRASLVWPLLVAPVGARWLAVYLLARYPSARPDGLAFALSSATSTRHLAQATALLALALAVAGARVALTVIPALLASLALAAFVKRRIAGITGDVIGAAIELVELVALMAAVWQ